MWSRFDTSSHVSIWGSRHVLFLRDRVKFLIIFGDIEWNTPGYRLRNTVYRSWLCFTGPFKISIYGFENKPHLFIGKFKQKQMNTHIKFVFRSSTITKKGKTLFSELILFWETMYLNVYYEWSVLGHSSFFGKYLLDYRLYSTDFRHSVHKWEWKRKFW